MSYPIVNMPKSLAGALAAGMPVPINQFLSLAIPPTPTDRPAEEQMLEVLRQRNGALDRIFYHVEPQDEARVTQMDHQSGSIIVVPPEREDRLLYFADAVEFLDDASVCENVIGISLAGVGSSPIGAVALARDVATVKQGPVAAIVSGYGVDDVVYEGLGGWLFLRETNRLEFAIEQVTNALSKVATLPQVKTTIEVMDSIGSGPDLVNLKSIIRSHHVKRLRWLVGHSKGNLLISSAISELAMEGTDLSSTLAQIRIVLLSALSALPQDVGLQYQIIGDMDVLGWVNSRLNIGHKLVHGAMHHLNRELPFHLNAQQELALIQ